MSYTCIRKKDKIYHSFRNAPGDIPSTFLKVREK